MKIRSRIALVFTGLTAAVMLMLSAFIYTLSLQHVHEHFITRLRVRASITAESNFGQLSGSIVQDIRERHLARLPEEQEFVFTYSDKVGDDIAAVIPDLPKTAIEELVSGEDMVFSRDYRHYVGLTYHASDASHIVVAVAHDDQGDDHIRSLLRILILGFSGSCLLIFCTGHLFAVRIIRPISSIISRVNSITSTNMHERLPEGTSQDELNQMARTFNNMLDRLETSFDLQSHFISNASHELRTPLTAVLGEAEITLQKKRTPDEYVNSLRTIHREAKRLDDVTASLLTLSQISYDGKRQKFEPVAIDELLMSIKVGFDKRHPENNLEVITPAVPQHEEIFHFVCVRIWMELALTNIIHNSIKYSGNQRVSVAFTYNKEEFFIEISDRGIGIPEDEIKHIFEPFYRASNTTKYAGHGIGLPLAERIIRLHGGKMRVKSSVESGTHVSLRFARNLLLRSD